MISIYTRTNNPLKKEFWKWVGKKILKRPTGPDAVLDGLKQGLKAQGIPFEINPLKAKYDIIHVISGIEALKHIIKVKKPDQTLLAGPNLVISPLDHAGILTNEKIDKIILPSEWTAEVYSAIAPVIKNKIYIWPAGVKCNVKAGNTEKNNFLIYKKNTEEKLYQDIIKYLTENNLSYDIIEYGRYKKSEYFHKLSEAKLLIYLQVSESQGLALQEAWAHGVPTFVWNKGYIFCNDVKFDGKISAPYLTEMTGEFFKDFKEFMEKLPSFIKNIPQFRPAEYCQNNLSIEKSTDIYINILRNKILPWKNNKK